MKITETQIAQVNGQIQALIKAESFYGKKLNEAGVSSISSAEDFQKLPFSEKSDLRNAYPLGLMTAPEEKIVRCTVSTLAKSAEENGIKKTAMIFIGDVFGTREANGYEESRLYAPDFSTEFRKGTDI